MKPRQEAQQAEMIENVRKEALEVAISRVSSIAQQEKLAAAQVKALEEGKISCFDLRNEYGEIDRQLIEVLAIHSLSELINDCMYE